MYLLDFLHSQENIIKTILDKPANKKISKKPPRNEGILIEQLYFQNFESSGTLKEIPSKQKQRSSSKKEEKALQALFDLRSSVPVGNKIEADKLLSQRQLPDSFFMEPLVEQDILYNYSMDEFSQLQPVLDVYSNQSFEGHYSLVANEGAKWTMLYPPDYFHYGVYNMTECVPLPQDTSNNWWYNHYTP